MRTIVYIDGFNLYFGSLKGSTYKWLDLQKLSSLLCKEQSPDYELVKVKYFTADINAKLSRRGEKSCISQQDYLLAIKSHSKLIEIIKGKYFIASGNHYSREIPIDFNKKYEVWRPEEKQTDVNIALHMLCDVIDRLCEQIVLFSNDSDLAPALRTIKERYPDIKIGVITPVLKGNRKSSADLKKYSDWLRHGIKAYELEKSQMPDKVITRKRKITKPEYW